MELKPGDLVRVNAYGGKVHVRRVVETTKSVVFVCKEDEWLAAQKEGREPVCIGFPLWDVKKE